MSGLSHPARQAALVLVLSLRAWAGDLEAVPGAPLAPTLALADPGGIFHALTDNRGRVVLVNFWASWCPPCLHEMPSLQRLAEATASRPFKVLAVNVGETPQRAEEALKRLGYKETLLLDRDQTAFVAWGGRVLPSSFLVACDGRVRLQALGPVQWDAPQIQDAIFDLLLEGSAECQP